ncbi:hypothetical protein KMW28_07900 [Flammeovirga yaeyamensis]|uniref:Lipoprotein n=1 Tax=Flammeovirga yaeyamensis TaxID=367791 RepID=A0AAX1N8F6_9BACT|nr:hypothetical protein [Flammeovirga yaeyamensis]MBB3699111.1 hypothetical protein [Flammeovirga yaeyamensis]NMF36545.1 hypothetical protein [Flammeovirga yaeyamensis]QWG03497.1 hypothetical protein KMW28_07900 [Flammeovirga yaeyamensis]
MTSKIYRLLTLCIGTLCCFSCQTNTVPPSFSDAELYYPIQEGWYISYQIDSVDLNYGTADNPNGIINQSTIQLMERIDKPFDDGLGHMNYRLERYKRPDVNTEWALDSIWSVTYRDNQVIRYENGVPYIKLVNPLYDRLKWNQNAFNNQGSETPSGVDIRYEVESVGRFYRFDDKQFDRVATIKEINISDDSQENFELRTAYYAQNIGLVHLDYSKLNRSYYVLRSDEPELVGNPYCNHVSDSLVRLGDGTLIDNPFYGNPTCEYNPIFVDNLEGETPEEKQQAIDNWIDRFERQVDNPPIVNSYTEGSSNGVQIYVVSVFNPDFPSGYNVVGSTINQKVLEYGINVRPGN